MLSGRRLDLIDPSPLDIEIEDIAHGLARVARWNGQTRGAHIFSVAQHSLLVEHLMGAPPLSAREAMAVLLHDGPEYVIGDLITPFKGALGEPYRIIERRLLQAIYIRFSLPGEPAAALQRRTKMADRAAAAIEATRLAGFSVEEARHLFGPVPASTKMLEQWLDPWPADIAEANYLDRFRALDGAPSEILEA